MEKENKSQKSNKRKKGFWITITIILLLFAGAAVYGYSVYQSIATTLKNTHEPLDRTKNVNREIDLAKGDPISVLLFGVDQREGDRGRPDSLMLLTINPDEESIKMLSIPRDTYAPIIGKGIEDKINHAYTYGGVDMSIKTIEEFLDIPIDYFIAVNTNGFQELVDAVGGVTVNNTLDFSYGKFHFPVGKLHLNGEEALKFTQMRHLDPKSDFGRQERQQKVMQAIIKEAANVKTLANYRSILEVIGNNLKTNLTFNEMKNIQANYSKARKDLERIQISGNDMKKNGTYYYNVPDEEREKLSLMLNEHLGNKQQSMKSAKASSN
ncbi:LytR family transcriptional regulator [Neobacillus piezotolerans]|uniref:LytR family transcriptional regulator n=1 Tax=Neobacillus piezotolerans TaxID=2259171 RepID=A0A3D8GMJ8_9BACI|nr:LCP family protein [Neobacillus piezotolerans]RDU35628.1 LytR family transcriptional regulator [Neobacillus piezotolerans]